MARPILGGVPGGAPTEARAGTGLASGPTEEEIMSVGRICVRTVHAASPEESVREAARRMREPDGRHASCILRFSLLHEVWVVLTGVRLQIQDQESTDAIACCVPG